VLARDQFLISVHSTQRLLSDEQLFQSRRIYNRSVRSGCIVEIRAHFESLHLLTPLDLPTPADLLTPQHSHRAPPTLNHSPRNTFHGHEPCNGLATAASNFNKRFLTNRVHVRITKNSARARVPWARPAAKFVHGATGAIH